MAGSEVTAITPELQVKPETSRWMVLKKRLLKDKFLILLCIPGVLNYIIWHYIPMYGILITFKDYKMKLGIWGSPWADMLGFKHIIDFFNNPLFGRLIINTVVINVLQLLIVPVPGIIFALFLNEVRKMMFKRVVQTVSYFPYFLSSVALVGIVVLALSPSTGFVNMLMKKIGLEPVYFLMEPSWFRTIFISMTIWQGMGWDAIVWLARITGIDPQLYETATIDGASRIKRMWYITLPAFKEWYFINLIIGVGGILASSGFEKIFLLYNPSTYEKADVIATYMYRRGLQMADYSYGAAVGFANTLICLFMLILANKLAKKFADESIW